jgi:N-terminal domain of toast_rack, DUF2154/Domain of unknown function (DUF5668)
MAQTGPQPGPPPMGRPRHTSFVGPILLIVIGTALLVARFYPDFDPWPTLFRYWPLILIFIGIGKIWDSYYARGHAGQTSAPWMSGTGIAWILVAIFFFMVILHHGRGWHEGHWHGRAYEHGSHDTQAIELQGAKSVAAEIQMPAGTLNLSGGSGRLLDATFEYTPAHGKPDVQYSVSGDHGQLTIKQDGDHVHWGTEDENWDLRMTNNTPIDLTVNLGAGESDLQLRDMNVPNLKVNMGAGELHLDLTGERKTNLDGDIEGGVGEAIVHLPKDIGVRVIASGGIGSVSASGLKHDGDAYVNDQYGKSPTTIDLTIHGGVGSINLIQD